MRRRSNCCRASQEYGCKAVGCDLDMEYVQRARENVKTAGVEKLVNIEHADVLDADLSGVTVVTLYLGPTLNEKLIPQLRKRRPGSRFVSHAFDIKGIPPKKVIDVLSEEDGITRKIYLCVTPLNGPS